MALRISNTPRRYCARIARSRLARNLEHSTDRRNGFRALSTNEVKDVQNASQFNNWRNKLPGYNRQHTTSKSSWKYPTDTGRWQIESWISCFLGSKFTCLVRYVFILYIKTLSAPQVTVYMCFRRPETELRKWLVDCLSRCTSFCICLLNEYT